MAYCSLVIFFATESYCKII